MVVTAMRRGCCFGEIQTGVFRKSWNTFYNLLSNGSGKKRHIYLYSYGERQNERERERKWWGGRINVVRYQQRTWVKGTEKFLNCSVSLM